jgi:tetratricopeptide (TPR) repeat protein
MNIERSLAILNQVRKLSDTGRHTEVIELLDGRGVDEVGRSPTLALVYGIAFGRRGHHGEGRHWVDVALTRSRERGDRAVEARALNVRGALELEAGCIEKAVGFLKEGLAKAKLGGDHCTVGRCANNLGIIAALHGDYGRAVGAHTLALAAFQRAGLHRGIGEIQHNLAFTYREQGDLKRALKAADRAVEEAQAAGDRALEALARTGRAEILVDCGDLEVAQREVDHALRMRAELGDVVGEAEDLRVFAAVLAASERLEEAERTLRDVIDRAEQHGRPLLAAQAGRDLARLLERRGQRKAAIEVACVARARFRTLGAVVQTRWLDRLISTLRSRDTAPQ